MRLLSIADHGTSMGSRPDTTLTVPRSLKAKMDSRKPDGVTWSHYLSQELGLEDQDTLSGEETERAIVAVAELAESAGACSAEEFEQAVRDRLEEATDE